MPGKETPSQLPLEHLKQGRTAAAIKGVMWSGWNALAPVLAGLAVFFYSAKLLSAADFGTVAMATAIIVVCSATSFGGFGEAIIQAKTLEERHLDAVFWLCLGSGAVVYVLLCLLSSYLGLWFAMPHLPMILIFGGLKILFDMLAIVPNALLGRSMSFAKVARRTTIASFLSAITCLIMLAFGWGIWALAANLVLQSLINWVVALYSQAWRPKFSFDRSAVGDLWGYGVFSSGTRVIQAISFDQILIGALLGPAQLGIYSFARRIFQMFSDLIAGALSAVSHALLSSLQTEHEKLKEGYLAAVFVSSLLSFPLFGGLAIIAPDFIAVIFGEKWEGATFTLQMFCCIGFLTCIGVLQASLITSQGRAKWWMNYQIFQQILTLALVVSTYRLGVEVFVFTLMLKTFATWPVTIIVVMRILDIRASQYLKPLVGPAIGTIAMAASIVSIESFVVLPRSYIHLSVAIAIGAFVYSASMLAVSRRPILALLKRGAGR